MNKDYSTLLENLMGRRYDEALRESIVTEAFEDCEYPEPVLYALEAMEEIDPSYAYKTLHLTKRIQDKISKTFEKNDISVDFRYQGDIQTETHIVLYGGIELIVLAEPNGTKPWKQVISVTKELMEVLTSDATYKEVNFSSKHKIKLTTLKPTCEISILPAVWLKNKDFLKTKREIDRGIIEFNLAKKTKRAYLPFMNIARVNSRDYKCNGGLKRMIRLLLSLQRDSEQSIDLSSHEITGLLYAIPEEKLRFNNRNRLSQLGVVSNQLQRLIRDHAFRQRLISPSEKELVFGKKDYKVKELQKLKSELDMLISDLNEALYDENKNIYSEIRYEY